MASSSIAGVATDFDDISLKITTDQEPPSNGFATTNLLEDPFTEITCFSQVVEGAVFHFQIIRLQKQIYAWVGCNSAKFGHLYAAVPTTPSNSSSVTSLIGGASDNTGSGIARRIVLKTGLHVVLACNIPKNSPMLEANAEKLLVQKLISLGYTRPKSVG